MDRLFFLTWEGLLFFAFLLAGHALGYPIVRGTRSRGWNDFAAIMLSCLGLALGGLADVFLDVWYIHPLGFGVLMGTVMFLASDLGRSARGSERNEPMADREWPDIIVFGADWCGDCRRTQQLLDAHKIPYTYHDVEAEDLGELVIDMNEKAGFGPRRRLPTLTIDGDVLSVPSNQELSARLGI